MPPNRHSFTPRCRPQVVALFKELGKDIDQEEADKMIASVDVNSDGKISFDEFCVVSPSPPQGAVWRGSPCTSR